MGHVTREQALVCLQNCPLLMDLAKWSHWDVVFRPTLKDLKDFIQKHGGVYQCTTLGNVECTALVLCKYCVADKNVSMRWLSQTGRVSEMAVPDRVSETAVPDHRQ